MAITINGTGTITGISAGGLPDNCVTAADLATTLDLSSNTVTLPSGTGGKILQVQSTTKSDTFSAQLTSETDITGMSVNITPSSTSSKVLVMVTMSFAVQTSHVSTGIYIYRDSTKIYLGDVNNSNHRTSYSPTGDYTFSYSPGNASMTHLDSPATTSQVTYKVAVDDVYTTDTIFRLNRGNNDDASYTTNLYAVTASSITAIEVAG